MTKMAGSADLVKAVDMALALVHGHFADVGSAQIATMNDPLPSLLQECQSACASLRGPQPVRTIHHFACTGGTLMTKALAVLPNTVVLSELDPLSNLPLSKRSAPRFAPTDVIHALRSSLRKVDDATVISTFLASLAAAKSGIESRGHYLILRDHAHSQFCVEGVDPRSRPTMHEMLAERFELRSLLTVRHPLDSFLSLLANNWGHFQPLNLEEYSRRYHSFVDRHPSVPVVRYEDFIEAPESGIRILSNLLDLKWTSLAVDVIEIVDITGGSGRKSAEIIRRPRRELPQWLDAERHESRRYQELCDRFGYEP